MVLFTPEGEELANKLRNDHMQKLNEEHDIDSSIKYINKLDNIGGLNIEEGVLEYLSNNNITLDAFFQITPYCNQKIMYSSLNPGLKKITSNKLRSGQLADHHNANRDVEQLAMQTMSHFGSYLTSGGPKKIIQAMRKNLDHLPDEGIPSHNDFVNINTEEDFQNSYFSFVNHTRYFKLRSPDKEFVDTFEKDYWRSRFAKEVEISDPALLICGCADAWKSIYDALVDNPDSDIKPHLDSTLSRKYSRGIGAVPGVFEVPSEELWVITAFHEQYNPDMDAFERNLAYVNDRLNHVDKSAEN